jgi:hypothetical protein
LIELVLITSKNSGLPLVYRQYTRGHLTDDLVLLAGLISALNQFAQQLNNTLSMHKLQLTPSKDSETSTSYEVIFNHGQNILTTVFTSVTSSADTGDEILSIAEKIKNEFEKWHGTGPHGAQFKAYAHFTQSIDQIVGAKPVEDLEIDPLFQKLLEGKMRPEALVDRVIQQFIEAYPGNV